MSIDRFYAQRDGKWNKLGEAELSNDHTYCWVDLGHGGNIMIDERYFFLDLSSAIEFYLEGWKERQYLDDDDQPVGLDHSGLYPRDRLIHGTTIHGDEVRHEGGGLRATLEKYTESLDEDVE
jgi:hypothetical protein